MCGISSYTERLSYKNSTEYSLLIMKKMCSLSDYLGGELLVEQGGVHGEEGFVAAMFDGAFAVAVD